MYYECYNVVTRGGGDLLYQENVCGYGLTSVFLVLLCIRSVWVSWRVWNIVGRQRSLLLYPCSVY